MCSKLNPNIKPTSKLDTERLAGGSGALAAKWKCANILNISYL